jgi:hypothetical protein
MSFILSPNLEDYKSEIEECKIVYSNPKHDTTLTVLVLHPRRMLCCLELREKSVTVATDIFIIEEDSETMSKMLAYCPVTTRADCKLLEMESGKNVLSIRADKKDHIELLQELGYFKLLQEVNAIVSSDDGDGQNKN